MPFSRTRPILVSLALSLLCPAASFAQAPAATVAAPLPGYHWHTLVLQHAVPSDILKLMRWDVSAPSALPAGVRRVFALQSNNSLLLQATEEGFATAARLIRTLDVAPRRVRVDMVLVTVPEARAGFYTPDMPASRLLPLLLRDGARTVFLPSITSTSGVTGSFSITYAPPRPDDRLRLIKASGSEAAAPFQVLLTPQINADGAVTLRLTFMPRTEVLSAPMPSAPPIEARTARAGESVVYDVSGPLGSRGERVFLFAKPTITDSVAVTDSVTVTP